MSVIEVASDLYLLLAVLGLAAAVQYADVPLLGQGAFVAVGAFGTVLLHQHGVPVLVAAVLAALLAVVSGYVLGRGAARLSGAALALATWVLAWLVQAVLVAFPGTFGGAQGLTVDTPVRLVSPSLGVSVSLTPTVHLAAAAVLCTVALAALWRVGRGPAGLDLAALRASAGLAVSLGVDIGGRRRQVLAAAAALGAVGGAGSVLLLGTIAPADVSPLLSLQLLVAVLLGGAWRPFGAVAGFAVVAALPHVSDVMAQAAGVPEERTRGMLTAVLLVAALAGRAPARRLLARRARGRRGPGTTARREALAGAGGADAAPRPAPARLAAAGLTVRFGPVAALDGVDLEVQGGEVHAIIGPNGSGKTTLLRVLAGAHDPDAGTVTLDARVLRGGQRARVRAGVTRTPQRTVVLDGLSPATQARVGARAAVRTRGAALRHLLATPQSRRDGRLLSASAQRTLALVGLDPAPDYRVTLLGAGEQRLLQVGRAAATGARVLLLDEPAAGLSPAERRRLVGAVKALAAQGVAVCVVDHDMRFVAAVATTVTVLAEGRVLMTGDTEEVRRDPRVRRAYLGDDAESA